MQGEWGKISYHMLFFVVAKITNNTVHDVFLYHFTAFYLDFSGVQKGLS